MKITIKLEPNGNVHVSELEHFVNIVNDREELHLKDSSEFPNLFGTAFWDCLTNCDASISVEDK